MLAEDLVRMFLLSIESVFSSPHLQRQTERHPKLCHRKVDRVQRAGWQKLSQDCDQWKLPYCERSQKSAVEVQREEWTRVAVRIWLCQEESLWCWKLPGCIASKNFGAVERYFGLMHNIVDNRKYLCECEWAVPTWSTNELFTHFLCFRWTYVFHWSPL